MSWRCGVEEYHPVGCSSQVFWSVRRSAEVSDKDGGGSVA